MEKATLKKRIEVAVGRLPADVVIKHCNVVDVYTGTIQENQSIPSGTSASSDWLSL